MGFLKAAVSEWDRCSPSDAALFVTVDGDKLDAQRVQRVVSQWTGSVFHVGHRPGETSTRLGVAANKNTGIELMIDAGVEHLFLSDDDCYPLLPQALGKHMDFEYQHSMVCWGGSRLDYVQKSYAAWGWPRGVMMYAHRDVIYRVGGLDERLRNAHEHAEWSTRIHDAGLTAEPFVTPRSYAEKGQAGAATRASLLWHCEDMRRAGEPLAELGRRRQAITSIDKAERDWDAIHAVMAERAGTGAYVPYRAHENGRASAILCPDTTSRGADT